MKKTHVRAILILLLFLLAYPLSDALYAHFFVPVYILEENVVTITRNGTDYALHTLRYNGVTYRSEPFTDSREVQVGPWIGQTVDGMLIYTVQNDPDRIVMKGFMYPQVIFKKQR
ncbi:MAG: hypothetical protein ACM32O_10830 [Clostridia bacterium]